MKKEILLTGESSRKALLMGTTKGHCGYGLSVVWLDSWLVWDHRGNELRGKYYRGKEACKNWLQKNGGF